MSLAELFESGEMKEHKGAFRNLVLIAKADGFISEVEKEMLDRMGDFLGLRDDQKADILSNPEKYPINPPVSLQERRERLVDLVRMVMVDGEIDAREMKVLYKCGVGLGYKDTDLPYLVNRIQHYILQGMDRNGVIEAMLSEQV
ncbi:MAG: TerB family tellurite resistance protein [Flavobacteriales bacterium]|nr:TerB family tellurite resistance protein [Flavobacteriales bacterium]